MRLRVRWQWPADAWYARQFSLPTAVPFSCNLVHRTAGAEVCRGVLRQRELSPRQLADEARAKLRGKTALLANGGALRFAGAGWPQLRALPDAWDINPAEFDAPLADANATILDKVAETMKAYPTLGLEVHVEAALPDVSAIAGLMLKDLCCPMTVEETKAAFQSMDKNGNGDIDVQASARVSVAAASDSCIGSV